MKDDRFTNLEKDIIRTVGRVLSSQEISDLKKAPGAKTEEHLDEGVQDIDADQLYQAMKQIN